VTKSYDRLDDEILRLFVDAELQHSDVYYQEILRFTNNFSIVTTVLNIF